MKELVTKYVCHILLSTDIKLNLYSLSGNTAA